MSPQSLALLSSRRWFSSPTLELRLYLQLQQDPLSFVAAEMLRYSRRRSTHQVREAMLLAVLAMLLAMRSPVDLTPRLFISLPLSAWPLDALDGDCHLRGDARRPLYVASAGLSERSCGG